MVFYLQQHAEDGRWLIDTTFPQRAHRVMDSREAPEWLEAKRLFGIPLSPVQEVLLAKHNKERADLASKA